MLSIELKEDNTFSYSISGTDDTIVKEVVEIAGLAAALLVHSGTRYAKSSEAQRRLTIERILDSVALDAANVANQALDNGEFDRAPEDEGQTPEA